MYGCILAETKTHPKQSSRKLPQMSKSIYIKNKYTKTYFRIIDRAKKRSKPDCYTENHHTIPKCITKYLGLPESEKVTLTFKEHFIVHHLLLKMVSGKLKAKMYYAFNRMGHLNGKNRRKINSKMFERIKIANRELCSGKNSPVFGSKRFLSEETKAKQKEIRKYRIYNPRGPYKGEIKPRKPYKKGTKPRKIISLSKEHKQHISESMKEYRIKKKLLQAL
jgi:hypothetical protein